MAHLKFRKFDKFCIALHMHEENRNVDNAHLVKNVNGHTKLHFYENIEFYRNKHIPLIGNL